MTQTIITVNLQPAVLLDVFVPGRPAPQGSKQARPVFKGRGADRQFTGRVAQVESSPHVKVWRDDVRGALLADDGLPRHRVPAGCPVAVRLAFVMPRPTSTPKRRTPPAVRRPDLDKLSRSCLDAIVSAGVLPDDSQVVDLHATKRIAGLDEPAGCHITIQEVP